jgi:hypothetical protein
MAFVLNKKATYFWPVRITLAADDGGQRTVETLDLEFRRLAQSRIDAIVKQAKSAERSQDENDELHDQEVCKELVAGWRNVKNDAGDELPFSDAAFIVFLEIQTVPGQVIRAWFESLQDGKRKN